MDELWQRYRSFWMPVLIGLGVFLVGLIGVFIATEDPEAWQGRVQDKARELSGKVEPAPRDIENLRDAADRLQERVGAWAARLDQARGGDPVAVSVADALEASILRGLDPDTLRAGVADPTSRAGRAVMARFDGDEVVAARALGRYQQVMDDRIGLLQAGDPNIGFSRLLSDVWSELRLRGNRADVELRVASLGLGAAGSVTRATLPERLLNLALAAQLVDLAIRGGAVAVEDIRYERRANPEGTDVFLREWPVTFVVRGDMQALDPILAFLTDADRPRPLLGLEIAQPRRGEPEAGVVELKVTVSSALVRPDADLDLGTEEQS